MSRRAISTKAASTKENVGSSKKSENSDGQYPEAEHPARVVLDPRHDGAGEEAAAIDGEVVPVVVELLLGLLRHVGVIELVGSECGNTRPDVTQTQSSHVKA